LEKESMNGVPAPVVVFAYNRPDHLQRTFDALRSNELATATLLFVFCDGFKTGATEQEIEAVRKVRAIAKAQTWCKKLFVIESEHNKGLARSVIDGVSQVVNEYGRVIVLEDDMVSIPLFLRFMNAALDRYENEEEVISVSAYTYPVKAALPGSFFLRGADCWGWATWKRGWNLFEEDGKKLLEQLEEKKLAADFDFESSYPYTQMLRDQVSGTNSSWAVRWYASAFLANKLTLYPAKSFIWNIGIDGTGTHSTVSDKWNPKLAAALPAFPPDIREDRAARKIFRDFFLELRRTPIGKRILGKLKRILSK
jgi:hypothetical protein